MRPVAPVPPLPVTLDENGVPSCPLCALKLLSEPEIVPAAASVGVTEDLSTRDMLEALLDHYHGKHHEPAVAVPVALRTVAALLGGYSYTFGNERELRDGIAAVAAAAGLAPDPEHRLDACSRVDVMLPHLGLAIETKVKRAPDLHAQLRRYADHPRVRGVLLVTCVLHHGPTMAREVGGKPGYVVQLGQRGL